MSSEASAAETCRPLIARDGEVYQYNGETLCVDAIKLQKKSPHPDDRTTTIYIGKFVLRVTHGIVRRSRKSEFIYYNIFTGIIESYNFGARTSIVVEDINAWLDETGKSGDEVMIEDPIEGRFATVEMPYSDETLYMDPFPQRPAGRVVMKASRLLPLRAFRGDNRLTMPRYLRARWRL